MKKIAAITIALLLAMLLAVNAMAATASITVENVKNQAKIGDEVSVGVSIDGNTGINGLTFDIKYDKSRLQLVKAEDAGLTGWVVGVGAGEQAVWSNTVNRDYNGTVLKLTFKVIDNAESGFAKIEITNLLAGNENDEEVPFSVASGGITVKGVCKHVNTEVRNEKAATCAAEGYTGDTYCKDCEELVKKGEATPKNPQNHIVETEIKNEKKANCVEKGYTGDTYCKGCGVKLSDGKETAIDPNNHKEIEVINKKEANCKDTGYTGDKHCKACDAIVEKGTEIAKNNNHKFGAWKTTKEATQYADGMKERVCSVCDKVETAKIPKLSDNTDPIHISANGAAKGEQNPNTGAESVIGVVALAAVCTGAYLVAKKKH